MTQVRAAAVSAPCHAIPADLNPIEVRLLKLVVIVMGGVGVEFERRGGYRGEAGGPAKRIGFRDFCQNTPRDTPYPPTTSPTAPKGRVVGREEVGWLFSELGNPDPGSTPQRP